MKKFIAGTIVGFTLAISSVSIFATAQDYLLTKFTTPIYINGVQYQSDTLPVLSLTTDAGANTYVPLRKFSEMTGYKVDYDATNKVINITDNVNENNNNVTDNGNNVTGNTSYLEDNMRYAIVDNVKYVSATSLYDNFFGKKEYGYTGGHELFNLDYDYSNKTINFTGDAGNEILIENVPYIIYEDRTYINYDLFLNDIYPLISTNNF